MKIINIVIPMAGLGSRFVKEGYDKPKPFIDVNGKPMIIRVLENLAYPNANYILIGRKEHLEQEKEIVAQIKKDYNVTFISIDKLTEGSLCTILYSRKYINSDTALLVANSDQIIDCSIVNFINDCFERNLDGSILTFRDNELNPKWSFVKLAENGFVTEVKEKEAISEYATVGIYLFSKGNTFVNAAVDLIIENNRVNNEFYTCPVYNYLINSGLKIGVYEIAESAMNGIGTPEDLGKYVEKLNT